jgi:hypothetical protein
MISLASLMPSVSTVIAKPKSIWYYTSEYQQTLGGIGGPKPSNLKSQTSDMYGGLRRNFVEIPSLPEQTAAKTYGFCSAVREKLNKVA